MKFSSTLKELREQNHVTQNQLASHLKLTRSTIAGYETKGKQPDYERLLQIADYFHVSVDYLLTGSETNGISVPPDSSEYRLLCAYLNLSSDSRQQLFEYTEFLQDQDTKKGKDAKINCAFFPFFFNFLFSAKLTCCKPSETKCHDSDYYRQYRESAPVYF